jgi:hypothetical protein
MTLALPRYVIAKPLAAGSVAFYFNVPSRYRKLGCTVPNTPLGADYVVACGQDGNGGRAAALNALFNEWDATRHGLSVTGERVPIYGTIRWLFPTQQSVHRKGFAPLAPRLRTHHAASREHRDQKRGQTR